MENYAQIRLSRSVVFGVSSLLTLLIAPTNFEDPGKNRVLEDLPIEQLKSDVRIT